jgi:cobalt-zinc-cadmium efflux system membrane fusion protein
MRCSLFLSLLGLTAACSAADPVDEHLDAAPAADTATLLAASVAIGGFTLVPVDSLPWAETWRVVGRLVSDPASTSPIGSIVEGRIAELRALPGERVRAGDVLALIHTHEMMDARRDLSAATAHRAAARDAAAQGVRELARAERLLELRAASTADLERARVARSMTDAALGEADAAFERAAGLVEHLLGEGPDVPNLDPHHAVIRAPIDGVVIERPVQPGQVVLVGAPLYTVAHTEGLVLEVYVPETGLSAARVGAAIRFQVPAFPGRTFAARVTRVAPALDAVSRTIALWALIDDRERMLRAEMVAQAELAAAAGARVLSVPSAAVQAMEGDTVVIVAREQDGGMHIAARPVRVGRRTGERVEILAGLSTQDQVILQGAAIAKAELLKRRGAFGGDDH